MRQLVTSLVLSRINYCSIVLVGLPASTVAPLQRVQNAATRRVLRLDRRSHITAALHELHWLPVKYRIQFKISRFIHQVTFRLWYRRICAEKGRWSPTNQPTPSHRSTTSIVRCWPRRLLLVGLSAMTFALNVDSSAIIQRTRTDFGRRTFAVCGPDILNTRPPSLRTVTSHSAFRPALKIHFYNLAFFLVLLLLPAVLTI